MVDRPLRDKIADIISEYFLSEANPSPWDLSDKILDFLDEEFDRQVAGAIGDISL
jgi:hypothetical protein